MTLTEFLLARVAEDEAAADQWPEDAVDPGSIDTMGHPIYAPRSRVLTECEAKRQILGSVEFHREYSGDVTPASDDLAKTTLRALALPYADHPDYDEEWKP